MWSDLKQSSFMFNARTETVRDKPAYRTAYRRRRCVIPASGFYEWKKLTAKTKEPWHIFRQDGEPLIFAGLYESCDRPEGHVDSCTIITTEPNEFMEPLHNRMPLILSRDDADVWLSHDIPPEHGDALFPLLRPCPAEWLTSYPTNPIVSNTRNETPDCIKPIENGLF